MEKSHTFPFTHIEHARVLVFIKPWDEDVFLNFVEICQYLLEKSQFDKITVYIEHWLLQKLKSKKELGLDLSQIAIFDQKDKILSESIQFLITLGGDGTILYAAKQYHGEYIPPIISFSVGSLGYLCNFEFEEYKCIIDKVVFQNFKGDNSIDPSLDLRMRLKIEVLNKPLRKVYKGQEFTNYEEILIKDFHVINEVVIDRGPSPYSIQIEIYIDDNYFTTAVGDGLIVSTPTGSTAYNLAAGGSIVQSNVPAISMTPLAPHSLSFRPLILPENCIIKLKKPEDGRSSAWVSLDGATRFELFQGEEVIINASQYAVALVTNPVDNLTGLWSKRLTKLLNWNDRPYMKQLNKKEYGINQ